MATDLPDWSTRAYIASGVTIIGTVDAVVTNQPTVNLANTSTITITNPILNVQGVAGGTAIGIAGTVSVGSGTINVGTVTGNVNVENVTNGVLQVGNALDLLGTFKFPTAATTHNGSFTVTRPYGALLVQVAVLGAGGKPPLSVQAFNATNSQLPKWYAPFTPLTKTTKVWAATVPIANEPGQTVTVSVRLTAATTAATEVEVGVSGLTTFNGEVSASGIVWPVGSHTARGVLNSATPVTIIPSPGTIKRILIKSLVISAKNLGTASVTFTGLPPIWTNVVGAEGVVIAPPGGLLGPVNRNLKIITGAATELVIVSAVYDIV